MIKIYKYTNKTNGKVYIGQTKNSLGKRAQAHGSNYMTCPRFWEAIKKYGWDNFEGEVILDSILTKEEADLKEQYYISLYKSDDVNFGYNISPGVHTSKSQYERELISQRAKERYSDPTNNPMYGKKHSKQSLQKMSDMKKGDKNPMFGKHMTEESKLKRLQTCKEKGISFSHKVSEENKRKASKRFKERAKEWAKPVRCIEDGKEFPSISDCAKYYDINDSTLSEYLRIKEERPNRTCAGGRHFEFILNE